MPHIRALSALGVLLALTITAACANDSDSANDPAGGSDARVVEVTMTDNAFDPTSVDVDAGEEVTLRFTNDGALRHEAYLGTSQEQDDHHADMAEGDMNGHDGMEGMGDHGDDNPAVTVEPGGTREFTHRFDTAGEVMIGCHEPGHYESGMKATITVS